MEAILIATDFSQPARNAALYAAQLGKLLKVKNLVLYHAYKLSSASGGTSKKISREKIQESKERLLSELRDALLPMVNKETLILTKANSLPLEIGVNSLANSCEAKLLIIGSERNILKKMLMGRSTNKLLKACNLPILIVPPQMKFKPIRKIVMACDLKDVAATIPIARFINLINSFKTGLTVVNINGPDKETLTAGREYEQDVFYDLFEQLDPTIHYIDDSNVSKGILDYADQTGAQLIAVVAKKHSFIERLTKASVSEELVAKSEIPILVIRK